MITTYNATDLSAETGDRVLSVLHPDILADGDRAFVVLTDPGTGKLETLYFEYDAASIAETNLVSHPYRVRPNEFAGAGVWIEAAFSVAGKILYGAGDPPPASSLPDGTVYLQYV